MTKLLQFLLKDGQFFNTIAVIGAGNGSIISEVRQLQAKHLILVEAHPDQANILNQMIIESRREEVRQVAITHYNTPFIDLHVFSLPKYNTLSTPEEITKIAPNLKELNVVNVPAISFSAFIKDLELDCSHDNLLILDIPGQCTTLLNNTKYTYIQQFSWIIISGFEIPNVYNNEKSITDIIKYAETHGFKHITSDPDSQYPHSTILLRRDELSIRCNTLGESVTNLRAILAEKDKLLNDHLLSIHRLELLNERLKKIATERTLTARNLRQDCETLASQKTTLAKELTTQTKIVAQNKIDLDILTKERDELSNRNTLLKHDLNKKTQDTAQLTLELDETTKERDNLIDRNNFLTRELEKLTNTITKQADKLDEIGVECETLTNQNNKISQKIDQQLKHNAEQAEIIKTLTHERDTLVYQKANLAQALDNQKKIITEQKDRVEVHEQNIFSMSSQIDTLSYELDIERQNMSIKISQLEKLSKEFDKLNIVHAELTSNFNLEHQELKNNKHRIFELEAYIGSLEQRVFLFQQELLKAETQIDMIQSLLLSEASS